MFAILHVRTLAELRMRAAAEQRMHVAGYVVATPYVQALAALATKGTYWQGTCADGRTYSVVVASR
jgi:hypothetical protein